MRETDDDLVPPMPPSVPRVRPSAFARWFGRGILRLGGWRVTGELPDVPKLVLIAAPHSSNWDGIWGMDGEIALETVSGDVRLTTLGERVRKLKASSVSGDMDLSTGLAEDGEIRLESVSGDLLLRLPANLSAQVQGESFSGDLAAPGAKIKKEAFGPGSSFRVRYGAGKGDIRLQTFSGDARLVLP